MDTQLAEKSASSVKMPVLRRCWKNCDTRQDVLVAGKKSVLGSFGLSLRLQNPQSYFCPSTGF
jgi:hypothetical protein